MQSSSRALQRPSCPPHRLPGTHREATLHDTSPSSTRASLCKCDVIPPCRSDWQGAAPAAPSLRRATCGACHRQTRRPMLPSGLRLTYAAPWRRRPYAHRRCPLAEAGAWRPALRRRRQSPSRVAMARPRTRCRHPARRCRAHSRVGERRSRRRVPPPARAAPAAAPSAASVRGGSTSSPPGARCRIAQVTKEREQGVVCD